MPDIARLKITLDEVRPRVVRRLEVPLDVRLDDLHMIFQAVMPWENYHLYEFRAGKVAWGEPDPEWDFPGSSPLPARQATLRDLLGGTRRSFSYVYDFGDDWRHSVRVEATGEADPETAYPRLLTAEGRCPPEDVGGPWGYGSYLEAIADPGHERHAEMIDWRGPGFDPATADEAAIRKELARLAKRFARRKPKTKP